MYETKISRLIDIDQCLLLKNGSMKYGSEINIGDKLITMNNKEFEVADKELVKAPKFKITFTSKYDNTKIFYVIDIFTFHWNRSSYMENCKKEGRYRVTYFKQIYEDGLMILNKESKSFNKNIIGEELAHSQAKDLLNLYQNDEYIIHQCNPLEFLQMPNNKRIYLQLFQTDTILFNAKTKLDFDPYILGVWLGDGTSSKAQIASEDVEIIEELRKRLVFYNLDIIKTSVKYMWNILNIENQGIHVFKCEKCNNIFKEKREYNKHILSESHINQYGIIPEDTTDNRFKNSFLIFLDKYDLRKRFDLNPQENQKQESLGIENKNLEYSKIRRKFLNNKHIPDNFKFASKKDRLELLAGLIDTDGHLTRSSYEIVQKNTTLANDIIFVARSLGFYVHSVDCEKSCMYKGEKRTGIYRRMNICSTPVIDITEIPVVLDRKKCKLDRNIIQNKLHHTFTCEKVPEETNCWKITFNKTKEEGYKDFALINSDFLII